MKTVFRLALVSILWTGMVSFAAGQIPEVTHNTWTSGTPLPTPVAFATAAVLKDEVYVVGGNLGPGVNGNGFVADVQIYNPATNSWSTGVSYPAEIASASAAVVKNILYVFGGTPDGMNPSNAVWAYNPKTKTWAAKAAMPTARWGAAAVIEKDIVYVIGGSINASGNGNIDTVESYNPATNTWTEESPLLVAKSAVAAGLSGTTIVVADGGTNGGGTTGDNEGYDAATNTWKTLAGDPASRYASCYGAIGAKLYDMGGQTATTYSDDFQLSKDKWTTTLASVPQSTIFPASAVYKKQLYCFGGWGSNGGAVINDVQVYQP